MKKEIETAVELLAKKITDEVTADEALKFTQAALNLAHTAQVVNHTEKVE